MTRWRQCVQRWVTATRVVLLLKPTDVIAAAAASVNISRSISRSETVRVSRRVVVLCCDRTGCYGSFAPDARRRAGLIIKHIYLFIYQVLSTIRQTVQNKDDTISTLKDAKAYSTHRRLEIQQVLPKVIWEKRVALALCYKIPLVTMGHSKFTSKS